MITVLKICPGQTPETVTIPHTLEAMQQVVGGNIEAIYPFDDEVALICNEEGKLLGQQPNRAIRDDATGEVIEIICGTFFICGLTHDDFGSLTPERILYYKKLFHAPELFLWNGKQLVILPA